MKILDIYNSGGPIYYGTLFYACYENSLDEDEFYDSEYSADVFPEGIDDCFIREDKKIYNFFQYLLCSIYPNMYKLI